MTDAIAMAAAARGFDADTVRAIVEVESGRAGAFGPDRRPIILYEPHVAWRVSPPAVQRLLADAGLARAKWRKDYPPSQAARWDQFDRCADLAGRDVAVMACSWGLGQVLGENWRMCGFGAPAEFEAAQATEAGQIETMLRYLEGANMAGAINARDWRSIARAYNGPGQVDRYAALMEAAYRRVAGQASPVVLRVGSTGADVRRWQRVIGEREDGHFGPATKVATETWQRANGLAADGMVGARTWARAHEVGAAATPPAAQPVPTPKADWTKRTAEVAAAVSVATAAAKGVIPDDALPVLAGMDPMLPVGLAAVAGAVLLGVMWLQRARS